MYHVFLIAHFDLKKYKKYLPETLIGVLELGVPELVVQSGPQFPQSSEV